MSDDDNWMSLCVTVLSAKNLSEPASNLQCIIDFDGYEWKTKAVKRATAEPVWDQSFELGPYEDDNDLVVRCISRQKSLGLVRFKISDVLPDGTTEKEYSFVDDEDRSTAGSLVLSVSFVEKSSRDSRKKAGFWRRLYSFLLGRRTGGDESDADTNEDTGGGSASNSPSGTPRESSDGGNGNADETAVPSTIVIRDSDDEGAAEGQLFGRPLPDILEAQRDRHPDLDVPWFIWASAKCIREKEGLIDTMGLFRVRGRLAQIKELKNTLNSGNDIDIDGLINENPNNIHNITSLIKTFLRELPTPLIVFEYYDEFLKCADYSGRKQEKRILRTIRKLPAENFTLIKFLCHLMYDVGLHSGVNMMNAENLSKVLSPNLIWKETVNLSDLSQVIDMKKANDLAQVMITHYYELFEGATVYSDPSASEEEESFSDVSSDDDDDDAGGRGGLDSLIEQMKKGQFINKSASATATSTSTSSASASPMRRPTGTK